MLGRLKTLYTVSFNIDFIAWQRDLFASVKSVYTWHQLVKPTEVSEDFAAFMFSAVHYSWIILKTEAASCPESSLTHLRLQVASYFQRV